VAWLLAVPLVLVGVLLLRYGVWGDRSRGRRRCPRCWYDMTGVGLRCPECGFAALDERALNRDRRRLKLAVLGALVAAAGAILPLWGTFYRGVTRVLQPRWGVVHQVDLNGFQARLLQNNGSGLPAEAFEVWLNDLLYRATG
jgi:hypothetical protein